ncbi:predicted protein [Chaetomium globosum CBS 148.51]|uniref:Uncharacterized protein n=1 Tax=Chaetomium globosum (strain ATCC 6205 / CBS 148.51 / DSM 1962 / NBRC 6347 / NRRL 1970) TaxID=306901 RepID=Q2GPF1_CHAGB|nr:uncharacterized protein CHGG_10153 [Chaetomium globosum CBS 148.51]EAQ83749.1 predicted protein [Chaetomium globosum CBS 148.51]
MNTLATLFQINYRACSKWVSVGPVVTSQRFVQREMNTVLGFHPPCQISLLPQYFPLRPTHAPNPNSGVLLPVLDPGCGLSRKVKKSASLFVRTTEVGQAHTFKALLGIHFWTQLPANVGPHGRGRDFDRRAPGWIAWPAAPLRRGGETSEDDRTTADFGPLA